MFNLLLYFHFFTTLFLIYVNFLFILINCSLINPIFLNYLNLYKFSLNFLSMDFTTRFLFSQYIFFEYFINNLAFIIHQLFLLFNKFNFLFYLIIFINIGSYFFFFLMLTCQNFIFDNILFKYFSINFTNWFN